MTWLLLAAIASACPEWCDKSKDWDNCDANNCAKCDWCIQDFKPLACGDPNVMKIENCIDPFTCADPNVINLETCIPPGADDLRECFAQRCADSACFEDLPEWIPPTLEPGSDELAGKPYDSCSCSWAGSFAKADSTCVYTIEITEAGAANCTGTFKNMTDPPKNWANDKGCTLTKGDIPNDPLTDEKRTGWALRLSGNEPVYWVSSDEPCPPASQNEDEAWGFFNTWESDDAEPYPAVTIGSVDFRCVRAPVGSHAAVAAFLVAFATF
jgi:hypothetical protein